LEQYKREIKELEECAVPTTPPKVRVQQEIDTATSAKNIVQAIQ
jgi:hypothetical protein